MTALALSMMPAAGAFAGAVPDADSDGVPDAFDNCRFTPNSPLAQTGMCSAQEDFDADGCGNPCDGDLTNSGGVLGSTFTAFLADFGQPNRKSDFDCDGTTLGSDFSILLGLFGSAPCPWLGG